jgi:mRNA interferase RelE/StbE
VNPRFLVIYSPPAERALRRLSGDIRRRIFARIDALAENPWLPGFAKLEGYDAYRVRVGDYRIIYSIDRGRLVVLVLDVGHRKDIYRRL